MRLFIIILLLTFSNKASANETQEILVIAKMAVACGVLDQMISFQKTTKMKGGDEFVSMFWSVEAARLGISVQKLSDICDESITTYDTVYQTLGK